MEKGTSGSHGRRPILVCNIGWMERYQGNHRQTDKIVGGGRYVREHEHGHEVCNFLPATDGRVYGHFETIKGKIDRQVAIERLGASASDNVLDNVDVVWVATDPHGRGRRVVGYYLDAKVYRERQEHGRYPTAQHRADKLGSFMVSAKARNAVLLDPDSRVIQLGRGEGWIGQANWWFPERSDGEGVPRFLRQVRSLLASGPASRTTGKKSRGAWGGARDPERNAKVEQAAIDFVQRHFSELTIKSVEKENKGWDLEAFESEREFARKRPPKLLLEVKGLSSSQAQVGVTPNEFKVIGSHRDGGEPRYRLCIVTDALSATPTLHVLQFVGGKKRWFDDVTQAFVAVKIDTMTAAMITCDES